MKDIAIYGAGGFGREIACLIRIINEQSPQWKIVGFFDDGKEVGTKNEYGSVLGGLDKLNDWHRPLNVVFAIGASHHIQHLSESITNSNISYPNIIAPNVTFLDRANVKFGMGNIICSHCLISTNVTIGNYNLLNGHIPVGHDTQIGDCNVIMPSVNISGGVQIGNGNFLGVQSVVLQNLKIGNNVRVGAGSVLMRNTKDGFLYMGNPAIKMTLK